MKQIIHFTTTYDFSPLLALLRIWTKITIKYGVYYQAADGTLSGCVRHRGIVPWDNDIELYIKYSQYDMIRSIDFGEYEAIGCLSRVTFRKHGTTTSFIDLFVYEVEPGTFNWSNCFPKYPVTHELTFYCKSLIGWSFQNRI